MIYKDSVRIHFFFGFVLDESEVLSWFVVAHVHGIHLFQFRFADVVGAKANGGNCPGHDFSRTR